MDILGLAQFVVSSAAGGAVVYAAIRSDIATLMERTKNILDSVDDVKDATDKAHARIDRIIENSRRPRSGETRPGELSDK